MTKRVLIVEDDKFTRELYEEFLKGSGLEVDTAVDGEDGLSKIKIGGYDIIMLDVMMPKMDGLDVLRALKNEPPNVQNGPIVLLTNLTHDPVINMAKDLGVKDYLVKSDITPGDLLVYINKTLGLNAPKPEPDQQGQ